MKKRWLSKASVQPKLFSNSPVWCTFHCCFLQWDLSIWSKAFLSGERRAPTLIVHIICFDALVPSTAACSRLDAARWTPNPLANFTLSTVLLWGPESYRNFCSFCVEIQPLEKDNLKATWLAIFREKSGVLSQHDFIPLGVLARNSPILKGVETLLCTGSHPWERVLAVPQSSRKGLTK